MKLRVNHTVMIDTVYDADNLPDDWYTLSSASKHAWLRANSISSSTDMKEIRSVLSEQEVFPEIVDAYVLG